jgi:hypothetical protein
MESHSCHRLRSIDALCIVLSPPSKASAVYPFCSHRKPHFKRFQHRHRLPACRLRPSALQQKDSRCPIIQDSFNGNARPRPAIVSGAGSAESRPSSADAAPRTLFSASLLPFFERGGSWFPKAVRSRIRMAATALKDILKTDGFRTIKNSMSDHLDHPRCLVLIATIDI